MYKILVALLAGLAFASALIPQDRPVSDSCIEACRLDRPNADLQRQEVITLEKEAARALQHRDGSFFRRVYSDDFSGTLSHGQAVDKAAFVRAVEAANVQFESVSASDIGVHLFRDTAVATCLWSLRILNNGQRVSSQIRVIHIYVYTPRGFRVVASQATLLPPFGQLPL